MENNENMQPQGWRSVRLDAGMPIGQAIEFLNVLNNRICNLEDLCQITIDENGMVTNGEGTKMSLTQFYLMQDEIQRAQAEAAHTVPDGDCSESID